MLGTSNVLNNDLRLSQMYKGSHLGKGYIWTFFLHFRESCVPVVQEFVTVLQLVAIDWVQTVHFAIGENPQPQATVTQDRKENPAWQEVSNKWLQGSSTVHTQPPKFHPNSPGWAENEARGDGQKTWFSFFFPLGKWTKVIIWKEGTRHLAGRKHYQNGIKKNQETL